MNKTELPTDRICFSPSQPAVGLNSSYQEITFSVNGFNTQRSASHCSDKKFANPCQEQLQLQQNKENRWQITSLPRPFSKFISKSSNKKDMRTDSANKSAIDCNNAINSSSCNNSFHSNGEPRDRDHSPDVIMKVVQLSAPQIPTILPICQQQQSYVYDYHQQKFQTSPLVQCAKQQLQQQQITLIQPQPQGGIQSSAPMATKRIVRQNSLPKVEQYNVFSESNVICSIDMNGNNCNSSNKGNNCNSGSKSNNCNSGSKSINGICNNSGLQVNYSNNELIPDYQNKMMMLINENEKLISFNEALMNENRQLKKSKECNDQRFQQQLDEIKMFYDKKLNEVIAQTVKQSRISFEQKKQQSQQYQTFSPDQPQQQNQQQQYQSINQLADETKLGELENNVKSLIEENQRLLAFIEKNEKNVCTTNNAAQTTSPNTVATISQPALDDLMIEVQSLEQQLKLTGLEKQRLENDIQELQTEMKRIILLRDVSENEKSGLQLQLERVRVDYTDMKRQLDQTAQERDGCLIEVRAEKDQLESLRQEFELVKEESLSISQKVAKDMQMLEEEKAAAQNRVNHLEEKVRLLIDDNSRLNDTLQNRLTDYQQIKVKAKADLEKLAKENETRTTQLVEEMHQEHTKQLEEAKKNSKETQQQLEESMQQALIAMESTLEARERQSQQLKSVIESNELIIQRLQNEVRMYKDQCSDLQGQINTLQQKALSSESSMSNNTATQTELEIYKVKLQEMEQAHAANVQQLEHKFAENVNKLEQSHAISIQQQERTIQQNLQIQESRVQMLQGEIVLREEEIGFLKNKVKELQEEEIRARVSLSNNLKSENEILQDKLQKLEAEQTEEMEKMKQTFIRAQSQLEAEITKNFEMELHARQNALTAGEAKQRELQSLIATLKMELQELQQKKKEQETKTEQLEIELGKRGSALDALKNDFETLKKETSVGGGSSNEGAQEVERQNQNLTKKLQILENEKLLLIQENDQLQIMYHQTIQQTRQTYEQRIEQEFLEHQTALRQTKQKLREQELEIQKMRWDNEGLRRDMERMKLRYDDLKQSREFNQINLPRSQVSCSQRQTKSCSKQMNTEVSNNSKLSSVEQNKLCGQQQQLNQSTNATCSRSIDGKNHQNQQQKRINDTLQNIRRLMDDGSYQQSYDNINLTTEDCGSKILSNKTSVSQDKINFSAEDVESNSRQVLNQSANNNNNNNMSTLSISNCSAFQEQGGHILQLNKDLINHQIVKENNLQCTNGPASIQQGTSQKNYSSLNKSGTSNNQSKKQTLESNQSNMNTEEAQDAYLSRKPGGALAQCTGTGQQSANQKKVNNNVNNKDTMDNFLMFERVETINFSQADEFKFNDFKSSVSQRLPSQQQQQQFSEQENYLQAQAEEQQSWLQNNFNSIKQKKISTPYGQYQQQQQKQEVIFDNQIDKDFGKEILNENDQLNKMILERCKQIVSGGGQGAGSQGMQGNNFTLLGDYRSSSKKNLSLNKYGYFNQK